MDQNIIQKAKNKVLSVAQSILGSKSGQVVSKFGGDLNRTLQNIGTGTGSALQTFVSQPLAGIKERNVMKSQNFASQAMQEKIRQQQGLPSQQNIPYLLNQSRAYSNTPDFTSSNLKFAESNLQKRIDTGTQQTGIKPFMQYAAPAVNVALMGKGLQTIGAMPLLQKAGTLGLSAGISGIAGKLSGQNPLDSAFAGILQTPRIVGLTGISAPATKFGAAGIMDKMSSPLARNIMGRGLTGLGNVVEDEILSRLDKIKPEAADRILSFGIGAFLAPVKEYEDYLKSERPEVAQKIRQVVRDIQGRYAKKIGVSKDSLDYFIASGGRKVIKGQPPKMFGQDVEKINKFLEQNIPGADQGFGNIAKSIRDEQGNILPEYKNTDNPLLAEARKYKSAEEFVKAQGNPLLHGTDAKFNEFDLSKRGINEKDFQSKNSVFFTDSMDTAKSYGENIQERYGKFKNPLTIDAKGEMYSGGSSDVDMKTVLREAVEKAKKEGNDVVIIKNLSDRKDWGNYEPSTHYAVLDVNNLKTKSQLTDIFNQSRTPEVGSNKVYHGTTEKIQGDYKYPLYTTDKKDYAQIFADSSSASSIGKSGTKLNNAPMVHEFDVNPKARILDVHDPKVLKMLNEEYFGKWSASDKFYPGKNGHLDWTEGQNLAEFIAEKKLPFDAIKLDEGGGGLDPQFGGKVIDKGVSYMALNKNAFSPKPSSPEVTNTPSSLQSTTPPQLSSPVVPKQQVSPLGSIIDPKAKLSALYNQAGDKFQEAHYQVLSEMDVAYAGKRQATGSYSSGFPQWVSPELRDRKLFDKVMSNVLDPENIVQPKIGSKEFKLQSEILSEIESRAGIDGEEIRNQLVQTKLPKVKIKRQIIEQPKNFYLAEPKPKSGKLTEAEYKRSVKEGLGATLTAEQLLNKQVSDIAKMIQDSTEKGIQRRISGKGATVFLAEPSTKKMIQDQKVMATDAYKDWQTQLFKQEGLLSKEQLLKKQLSSIGDQIKTNTTVGGVHANQLKDISGFKSYTRDVYRNFKEVYGNKFGDIKRTLLDPFDQAKGNLSRSYEKWAGRVNNEVEKGLGIMKGSKESAAVQLFGEGKLKPSQLIEQFGRKKAENIVNADKWFRAEYDKLLGEVNGVMARIYPNNPEKIIPRRSDYYRHFKEMGNSISGLLNIFDSPANISSSLAGTSEFVKPRSKWLSLAQKRLGKETDIDAVGGFLDYIKAAEYNKNIDPFTNQFRRLAEDLAIQTEKDPKLNGFIEYLHDFSNDLAGKTNPADRFVQKIIPGGRKTMSVINWLNNRVKANTIVGNLSSSVAQIFNVPQGIADAGIKNSTRGLGLSMANIFGEATPIKKSNFITERYGGGAFDRFDRSMVDNVKKGAVWLTGVLDEVGTKYIWNSQYAKAIAENIQNPIKFADDATRRMVAGRGIGEVPLIQKSKIFQLVAPFQLEVGNLWHVMGDWVGEKQFGKLATFFVASHLFNKAAEAVRGSDVALDPIQASIDAYNTYSQEEDKKIGGLKAVGRIGGEFLSNIPVAQNMAAAYPEFGFQVGDTKMPTRSEFFGEGDPTRFGSGLLLTKGLQDPLYKILPPFGGNQLKRTIEGQQATNRGYSESNTGRVRFPVENTPIRNAQRAVFGEYSTPAAREYFNSKASVLGEKQTEKFKELQKQSSQSGSDYYKQIVDDRKNNNITDKEKEDLKTSSDTSIKSKTGTYLIKQEDGSVKTIDISKPINKPTLTGSVEVDKKLKSQYNSRIETRVNDLIKLVENNQMEPTKAEEMIKQLRSLKTTKVSTKKPKKITVKKISLKKISVPKVKQIKVKQIKIPKAKTIKLGKLKKPKTIKLKTISYKK